MTPILRRSAAVIAVFAVLALLVTVAEETKRTWDLTAERSLSLSDQTRRVVERVRRRALVTAFVSRDDPGRAEISALLGRYRRLNRRIDVRLVDVGDAPGEASRLEVEPTFGGVVVTSGDKVERAMIVSEQDVTAALARIVRGTSATVCFTAGHGEADATSSASEGMAQAAQVLADNGYQLDQIDLLTRPEVPDRCGAVVIANPTSDLGPAAAAVSAWLERGGKAMVLADPTSGVDLSALVAPYAIGFVKGFVLEGDSNLRMPGDPLTLAVLRYRSTSPIVRRLPPTLFPAAQAVTVEEDTDVPGLSATAVLRSSPRAYLETQPGSSTYDAAADKPGPIELGAAADLSGNFGGVVRRTRVAAYGDVDWASNAYVGQAGNAALFVQTIDWLTRDEDLVAVSPNVPRLRALELTESRARYARLLTAGAVPALFVLTGAMVWAVRRGR